MVSKMNKKQELGFDIVNAVLGILLMISFVSAIHGHFWLSEFKSVPGSELVTLFSDDVSAEKENMETMRLIGMLSSVVLLCFATIVSVKYYTLHDDPKWEAKKGLGAGIGLFIMGVIFFIIVSDLFLESLSTAILLMSTIAVVGNTMVLLYLE